MKVAIIFFLIAAAVAAPTSYLASDRPINPTFYSSNSFVPSNTFLTPNSIIPSNTFAATNSIVPFNTFVAPNTFLAPNTIVEPNTFVAPNTFLATNTFATPNTIVAPNTFLVPNNLVASNTFATPNTFFRSADSSILFKNDNVFTQSNLFNGRPGTFIINSSPSVITPSQNFIAPMTYSSINPAIATVESHPIKTIARNEGALHVTY